MGKPKEMTASNLEMPFDYSLVPGSVKTAMKEAGAGSSDLWKVPIDELRPLPNFNVRIKDEKYHAQVRNLADSMLSEGYYQDCPISGVIGQEDGKNVIFYYAGHRRVEGAKLANKEGAGIERLPVVVTSGLNREDLTVALARENEGQPLTPFELGIVCKRLIGYGLDIPVIAARLSITVQYVNNLLTLMAAPIEIREMVIQNRVSASTAIEVMGKHGSKALEVLEAAQERAASTGKAKVTNKHVDPASEFKKECKARAGEMFLLLEKLVAEFEKEGTCNASISEIDTLVQEIKEKQL